MYVEIERNIKKDSFLSVMDVEEELKFTGIVEGYDMNNEQYVTFGYTKKGHLIVITSTNEEPAVLEVYESVRDFFEEFRPEITHLIEVSLIIGVERA